MLKLRKYLKPFAVSILAIVVLLFAQAMCELTMPDYMSNIVNVGINSNGVENGVLKAVRESEYDKLALFMDQDQKQVFADNYDLVTTKQADEELLQRYPALKQENIYILKDTLVNTNEEIKLALSQAETCVSGVEQEQDKLTAAMSDASAAAALSDEEKKMLAVLQQMPQGSTLFDVVAFMPSQQLDALKDQMNTLGDAMGQSSVDTANAQYVVKEYEAIGIDTDAIQYQYLFLNGALMLLLALGSAACAVAVGFLAFRIAAGLGKNLRHDVFRKVESFSLVEFGRFSTNTLLTRTTNDIQQIQMVLVMILRMVIYAPIIGIGALFKVLTSDVSMTWIIALVIIIILGIMGTAFLVVLPKFRVTQKLMDHLNAVVREFLDGMPVIRAFNNQKIEEKKFDEANRNIMKNLLFVGRSMGLLMPLIMLVMNCTSILIVWVGAHRIGEGVMQVGDMMAFMQYSMQIIMAFMMITMLSIMIPRASVAAGRIDEVLKSETAIKDPQQPQAFDETKKGVVEFKDVSFRYPGAEEPVLHHLNFVAQAGKTTAFIGSTGSGKSTLINLVPRFFDASEGEVLVDGVNVKEASQHELRERIGYVPQKGYLFTGTIASNLRYAKKDADEQEMRDASETAQALEFIENKPEGFETAISQGGTNVSGGQRQRLSIARALMKNPEIFIFDDTFSALDFKTDARLRKALTKMCKERGSTVLMVAQRISSILHADQIVVLDQGSVVGIGTHKELMESCDVYREIAYSQLSKEELEDE
ncbi:MAG: ABC transporter ATP-binding protein [Merdibacter sp.]